MPIILLTIAPTISGDDDWEVWYFGLVGLFLMIVGAVTIYLAFWRNTTGLRAEPESKMDSDEETGVDEKVA